jgi:hypothetical protein
LKSSCRKQWWYNQASKESRPNRIQQILTKNHSFFAESSKISNLAFQQQSQVWHGVSWRFDQRFIIAVLVCFETGSFPEIHIFSNYFSLSRTQISIFFQWNPGIFSNLIFSANIILTTTYNREPTLRKCKIPCIFNY